MAMESGPFEDVFPTENSNSPLHKQLQFQHFSADRILLTFFEISQISKLEIGRKLFLDKAA